MNSIHAVLRNWDTLQIIIKFLQDDSDWHSRRRDLVAVALVCRVLSDLALNSLWRDINMKNLNYLFPMDMIGVNPHGRKTLTRAPDTHQEWERFDAHASRIRKLSASPPPNDLFLRGFRTCYPTSHHPFPNLTRLRWQSASSHAPDVMSLICPTLMKVQLWLDEDKEEDDNVVADVLWRLGETCPRLRKFEYTHFSLLDNRSKTLETSLIYLIRQCRRLGDVRLPVSRNLLRSLASLPHLSMLRLDYANWEGGSQLSLPIQADEWIEGADRFPVLDDLTIRGFHTVSSLTECFQGSGCFPRTSFTMWEIFKGEEWSTSAIAEFFRGILRSDRSEGLLVFRADRDEEVEDPEGHDSWQSLRCLSSITPNLRTLYLDGLFLDINDTDLEEISQIWPELHSLELEVPWTEAYQSQISFEGLAHLSTLKNLETVSLMLAPESTISRSMFTPTKYSSSRLKTLKIQGNFPAVTSWEATVFLNLHFPRLEIIVNPYQENEKEIERIKEIQILLDASRLTMSNLHSERCSRRSRTAVEQEGITD